MSDRQFSIFQRVKNYLTERQELALIRASGLFDKEYYLANNPDVGGAKIDPLLHYLRVGGYEGRAPGRQFSSDFYLHRYQDVRESGVHPLIHYLRFGRYENRETGSDQPVNRKDRRLASYLRGKVGRYDLGEKYVAIASPADHIMRLLYARLYQKETFNLPRQIMDQYRGVSILFQLRRVVRKLKLGKIPIRIIFLAQEPMNWQIVESLYYACAADPNFKTRVINIGFNNVSLNDCGTYFTRKNIECLDGLHEWIKLDLLNPDLIVVASPYDDFRPEQYRTASLLRYAKLIYIPYGIPFSGQIDTIADQTFGNDPQKNAWRIFTTSEATISSFQKYGHIAKRRLVCSGTPKIDQYYMNTSEVDLPEGIRSASRGKFKIIYAPHHVLQGWSTFLQYGEYIRQLVEEHTDCYLVFRPHPLLKVALSKQGIMSEQVFKDFFTGERSAIYEGEDYYELFHWSDMLISDASSFLGEYAPTRNPIVYLERKDGWGLDDTVRENILNSCYIVHSKDELTRVFEQLKDGIDLMKDIREPYQEKISKGMFTGDAGKRIAAYLRRNLA